MSELPENTPTIKNWLVQIWSVGFICVFWIEENREKIMKVNDMFFSQCPRRRIPSLLAFEIFLIKQLTMALLSNDMLELICH